MADLLANRLIATRPDHVRRHNLAVLLAHVHRAGAVSRADLTQLLGLNRSTVGTLVAELAQFGLLEENVPSGGAGVGRPSHVVGTRDDGPFVLAVDIDVHELVVAAIGLGGGVRDRRVFALPGGPVEPELIVSQIGQAYRSIKSDPAYRGWLAGIGVSVPGTVRRADGRIMVAPNLDWRDVALDELIALELHWPWRVRMGNDADLGALAEHQRGAARGVDDVLYVAGRVGVGGGVIAGGVPMRGANGLAGEIGHVGVDPNGPLCHCGNRGCLETYVGEVAFVRMSGQSTPADGSLVSGVVRAAAAGDERARATVEAVCAALGRGLAGVANILNPAVIVVGGFLAVLFDAHEVLIRTEFDARMNTGPAAGVDIRRCALGRDSALLGAAEIGFDALLTDPVATTTQLAPTG